MRKIVFLFIVVLLGVIGVEGYYLYIFSTKPQVSEIVSNTSTASPTGKMSQAPNNYQTQALADYHDHIIMLKRAGIVKLTQSEYTYEYELTDIGRFPTPFYEPDIQKEAIAFLQYTTPDDWYKVHLNSHDFSVLTVIDATGTEEKNITFDDLKRGDFIRYYILTDIYEHPAKSAKKIVITKLK